MPAAVVRPLPDRPVLAVVYREDREVEVACHLFVGKIEQAALGGAEIRIARVTLRTEAAGKEEVMALDILVVLRSVEGNPANIDVLDSRSPADGPEIVDPAADGNARPEAALVV